ncbi:MAG TPA: SGNH/GDSL hydrolase family protein [Chitinophagaceae bacterium]|nr:SGNH/GDSL hydrolase family protein [Chitinophagaceae bacterium]
MKHFLLLSFLCFSILLSEAQERQPNFYRTYDTEGPDLNIKFFPADNPLIQYTGRIEFTNAKTPRLWSPGAYVEIGFTGPYCNITLNDEELYGQHNYIEIAIDDRAPTRVQTTGKTNIIKAAFGLSDSKHVITICKNTEASIGYIDFVGITCAGLYKLHKKPKRKIEFIGNSITCGAGSDLSVKPCGDDAWYDQHNAYMSYGPVTARMLNAQWQLSAVSGIGLIHSCCNMNILMPQVFDKVDMRTDSIPWDFSRYIPDVVTITLGQNDGVQDSAKFCSAYVDFIKTIRGKYPNAHIFCLTSPMADEKLTAVLKNYLTGIVDFINKAGDGRVHKYFYSQQYHHGCGGHPDLQEHTAIANELAAYIKKVMKW